MIFFVLSVEWISVSRVIDVGILCFGVVCVFCNLVN